MFVSLRKKQREEVPLIKRYQAYGIGCEECDTRLIAPIWSEYVSETHVRHSWSCESCGHQFETSDYLQFDRPNAPRGDSIYITDAR
jgi:hypothetical protein